MPTSDLQVGTGPRKPVGVPPTLPAPKYELTFVASPNLLSSILQQIGAWLREPKITVDKKYYRGEARLPIVEMRPWYRDLHKQLRLLFETPRDPIGFFNRRQEGRRVLLGLSFVLAVAAAVGWWIFRGAEVGGLSLAIVVGLALAYGSGYGTGALLFKKRAYPPDIWRDYQMQPASWINSLLVHAVAIIAILLPFLLSRMVRPVSVSARNFVSIDISPYLNDLAAAEKQAGGGGGGGTRTPAPPSKGALPKFAKTQFAPPMVVLPNPKPVLPVEPTLLGPPDLKLPQMQAKNIPWGDPQGVVGPPSNGPGFGGGIGTGSGGGVGSGEGGGAGPGSGGGTGGGPYAVGGNVSAPICIYQPMPAYSEEARKAKHQGTVVLWIVVNADGSVSDVRVVKPLGLGLDEKAVETVKTWKFKPGMRNGAPVPVLMSVEVLFRLL